MKRVALCFAALFAAPHDTSAQWIQWSYPGASSPCANGSCPTPASAKAQPAKDAGDESAALQKRIDELTQKLEELEHKDAVIAVQPPEDPNAMKSDDEPVETRVPTPDELKTETTFESSTAGRWTTGSSQEETDRVDRIMAEMSAEFGFDLDALEKVWKKFPVYYTGPKSYAGCTYWTGDRVDRINIVSAYDDKSDRVLRHELIHAILFYLTKNDVSLFMHEASTQQSEPAVRDVYVARMKSALAQESAVWKISSWYSVNSYGANSGKVYTYGYGVSEYLVSLGGKEWYFAFVLDYSRNGFESALKDYYNMTLEEFDAGLKAFYLKNNANRSSLTSLLESKR